MLGVTIRTEDSIGKEIEERRKLNMMLVINSSKYTVFHVHRLMSICVSLVIMPDWSVIQNLAKCKL